MAFYWIIWEPHNGDPIGITSLNLQVLISLTKYIEENQEDTLKIFSYVQTCSLYIVFLHLVYIL